MALVTFQLWRRRTVPCPISILETFNRNDHCMWQKTFGQEFKWLIMKTNQQFLTFLFIFTISTKMPPLYLSVSSESFVCNYSNFAFFTHSVQDQNPFPKKMGTEATFIIFSSYDRRMCLLHTDTDMVISHVTYSVIITSILTLLIICLWHRLYCSLSKQNGVSKQLGVAQVLKPPSFCCLYFAFTGNQCLYSACV